MNQTGLRESFVPTMNSRLFSQNPYPELVIQETFPQISNTSFAISKLETPIVYEIMPLHHEHEKISVPEGHLIPTCQLCGSFPANVQNTENMRWKCPVCGTLNIKKDTHIIPSVSDFDLPYFKNARKPIFLFIIQNSPFYTNPDVLSPILSTLDEFVMQNPNLNVAFASIGSQVTTFDLVNNRTHLFYPDSKIFIPICESQNSNFSKFAKNIREENCNEFSEQAAKLISKIRPEIPLVVTMFLSKADISPALIHKLRDREKTSLHLFCQHNDSLCNIARNSFKVHVFEDDEGQLVAPVLKNWLSSQFLFDVNFKFCHNENFSIFTHTTPNISSESAQNIPILDSESAVSVELTMNGNLRSKVTFQTSFTGTRPDGSSLIRVFTFTPKRVDDITEFNGVVVGTNLAREAAKTVLAESSSNLAYSEFYESVITMISAWSAKGQYMKSIDEMYRDAPIMMWALARSNLFNDKDKLLTIESAVNFLGLSHVRLVREIHPFLIIPPTTFNNRLDKKLLQNHTTAILLKAFRGKMFGDVNQVANINIEQIPLLVIESEDFMKELIENSEPTFDYFSEKVEVECNGRRFY